MSSDDFFGRVGTAVNDRARTQPAPTPASGSGGPEWVHNLAAAQCWAETGQSYFPITKARRSLPPGAYRCCMSPQGPYLQRMAIDVDNLLALPDSAAAALLAEFEKFWTLESSFAAHGYLFKRGILMWGPPGGGKTSVIWQMTQSLVKARAGVVVFIESPDVATVCLSMLRQIEPERPVVTVMEDLDALINQYGEHGYLALLDGESQINRVVHLATTNYPERLDRRFVDRPSRFDTIMFVDMPSAEARLEYFRAKVPALASQTMSRWVTQSEGYSIAHLREVVIATQCFGQPADKVFARLSEMIEQRPKSDGDGGRRRLAGFLSDARDGGG